MSETVTLISSDQEKFTVDRVVAQRSQFIRNLLEDFEQGDAGIPLPKVNGTILKRVCVVYAMITGAGARLLRTLQE
jgi:S-phase kinase-associated protein 1